MIQATELRIGNWIDCYMHRFQVGKISPELVTDLNADEGQFSIKNLIPIPLTAELLKECGFKKMYRQHDYLLNNWLRITHVHWKDSHPTITEDQFVVGRECIKTSELNVTIQYLHQLQNLNFALTGQELEIKF
jgi:hypothetical protein